MLFPLLRSKRSASRLSAPRSSRRRSHLLTMEQLERRELLAADLKVILEAVASDGTTLLASSAESTSATLIRTDDSTFYVKIYIQDTRSSGAEGVVGGSLDLAWSGGDVLSYTVTPGDSFTNTVDDTAVFSTTDPSLQTGIDNLEGTTTTTGLGVSGKVLFCTITMTAQTGAPVTFSVAEGDSGMQIYSSGTASDTDITSGTMTTKFSNSAPVWAESTHDATIAEHSENGTSVVPIDYMAENVSDSDNDALTYSFTSDTSSDGFAIDAATGEITISDASKLNLEYDDNSALVATLTVKVSDGAASATQTIKVYVEDVNYTPVLDAGDDAVSLGTITAADTEGDGILVSTILEDLVTDADANAVTGLAMVANTATNGTWQYSIDNGTTWQNVGTVSEESALLLGADALVRFSPTAEGEASFSFIAWDESADTTNHSGDDEVNASNSGLHTLFSEDSRLARITVNEANSAPELDADATADMTTISEDAAGTAVLVSDLLGEAVTDDDGAAQGIAVYSVNNTNGTWQYSTDGGTNWNAFGLSTGQARLLAADDLVRFVPSPNYSGTVTDGLGYYAWDQTSGTAGGLAAVTTRGGTTAFSEASATASITITAVNDAPVLSTTSYTLTAVTEDNSTSAGMLISALLGSTMSDNDTSAVEGIAITSLDTSHGTWQYKLASGEWQSLTLSSGSAFLLSSDSWIRFVPTANYSGTISEALKFRGWDQSDGNTAGTSVTISSTGTATAFSSQLATASLTITAVNDAPVIPSGATFTVTGINEDASTNNGMLVSALLATSSSSVTDADSNTLGIAVYAVDNTNGTWQYMTDGSTWVAFGSPTTSAARLLASDDKIRFVPNANYSGTVSSGLSFRVWDGSDSKTAGGTVAFGTLDATSAYSNTTGAASITVTELNDAPTLDDVADITIAKNASQQTVNLTGITAGGTESQTLKVTATSGNTTLIPTANLAVSYTSPNSTGTLTFTPVSGQTGSAVITVTVTDAGLDGTLGTSDDSNTVQTFTVTVGTSSITGYVYVDKDNDGVRDSSNHGVANVVVTLQQLSSGSYVNYATVVTGEDGSYTFSNIPAGTYQIVESQPDNIRDGVATAGTSGGTVSTNKITAITLAEDTAATGYNFGERGLALKYIAQMMCFTYSPTIEAIYTQMVGTSKLTISGTSSADTITVTAGTDYHTITINGVSQKVAAAVDSVIIDSGDGTDTVTMTGTSEDDVAKIASSTASLISAKYALLVKAAETMTVKGGTGKDSAEITDTTGSDTLTAEQSSTKISTTTTSGSTTTTIAATLSEFETIKAKSSSGGTDKVTQASALDYVLTLEGAWVSSSS